MLDGTHRALSRLILWTSSQLLLFARRSLSNIFRHQRYINLKLFKLRFFEAIQGPIIFKHQEGILGILALVRVFDVNPRAVELSTLFMWSLSRMLFGGTRIVLSFPAISPTDILCWRSHRLCQRSKPINQKTTAPSTVGFYLELQSSATSTRYDTRSLAPSIACLSMQFPTQTVVWKIPSIAKLEASIKRSVQSINIIQPKSDLNREMPKARMIRNVLSTLLEDRTRISVAADS